MNPMLKKAYDHGAQQAMQDFEKEAQGYYPPELMQLMRHTKKYWHCIQTRRQSLQAAFLKQRE